MQEGNYLAVGTSDHKLPRRRHLRPQGAANPTPYPSPRPEPEPNPSPDLTADPGPALTLG
eukprot:scaffold108007_cov42-Phaeocystis_antarctica.AAC.2